MTVMIPHHERAPRIGPGGRSRRLGRLRAPMPSLSVLNRLAFLGLIGWVIWATTYLFPGAELVIAIAIAAAAADLVLSGRAPDIGGSAGAWLLGFAAVALLTTGTSIWLGRSIAELRELAKLLLIFFLVLATAGSPRRLRWLLTITVLLLVLFPARGAIAAYFSGGVKVSGRADWRGVFGNANALAAILLLFLPFPYVWLKNERRSKYRLLWAGCFTLLAAAVIASKSRSGFLGLALIIVWSVWSARDRFRALGIAVALAIVVLAFGPEGWRERMTTMTFGLTDRVAPKEAEGDIGNWTSRVVIWRTAASIIADRPITGTGLGTFEEAHKRYEAHSGWTGGQLWRDTHNSFLRVWAETGVFGLVAFLGMLGVIYSQGIRALRRAKGTARKRYETICLEAGLIGLSAFLVTNLFNTFNKIWFFYLSLGILVLLTRQCRMAVPRRMPAPASRRRTTPSGRLATAPRT